MEVILLEKIKKLGNIGNLVRVKDGYARNYLFANNKALRATKENKEKFQAQKDLIEKNNAEKKKIALQNFEKINNKILPIIRQAGDDGRLYGSVTNKDIANTLTSNFSINLPIENIILHNKIKEIGLHNINLELHADVEVKIKIIVARSEEEAKNVLGKEELKDKKEKKDEKSKDKIRDEAGLKNNKKKDNKN